MMPTVRRGELVAGVLMGVVVLAPLLVYGPIDQEELSLGIFASQVHYAALRAGHWLFWFDGAGFGTPLPLGHRLDAHPAFALFSGLSLRAALSAVWLSQIAIATIYFLRLLALSGARRPLRTVLLACYLASASTIAWFYLTDWVTFVVGWTLFPALLFYLRRTLLEPGGRVWDAAVALAWVFGFLVLNSHPGYIAPTALSLAAYTLAVAPRSGRVYATLAMAFVLCVAMASERLYFFASEMTLFPPTALRESQAAYALGAYGRALIAPLWGGDETLRLPFLGAAVVCGAAAALWMRTWRGEPHLRGCASAFVVALVLSLTPNTALSWTASSGSWLFRDSLLLFGLLLTAATLQRWLDSRSRQVQWLTCAMLAVQLVQQAMVIRPGFQRYDANKGALDFYRYQGEAIGIGRALVDASATFGPRVYLSRAAQRTARGEWSRDGIYGTTDLSFIGLQPVNGWFKSTSMDRLYPSNALMHGFIGGEPDVLVNDTLLDALGVNLVVMEQGEAPTSPRLRLLSQHVIQSGANRRTFLIFGNPTAWPRASVVTSDVRSMTLPVRPGCSHRLALCRDYQRLIAARVDGEVTLGGRAGTYRMSLTPSDRERVIFLSMLYRPEWRASSSSTPLRIDPIADAFVGITVPAGVGDLELAFVPTPRVVLAWISGVTCVALVCCLVFLRMRREPVTA
jgi:hypothetical protein